MKKVLIVLFLLVAIPFAILAFLGFIPPISRYITHPRDLGITSNKQLVYDFESKYTTPNSISPVDLEVNLSSTEVTSIFAVWQDRDPYFPLTNVQVRFNTDGTAEASGYLKINTAIELAQNLGYSQADIEKGKEYIKYVGGDLPFYLKGTGGMLDNNLTINPSTFQLGRVTVPESITTPASQLVKDMITRRIDQIGGADIQRADFKGGLFHLVGSVPSTIDYSR